MATTIHYPPVIGDRAAKLVEMHGGADLGCLDLSQLTPANRWLVIERLGDEAWARTYDSREVATASLDSRWELVTLVDLITGDNFDGAGRYLGVTVFENPARSDLNFGDVI